MRAYSGAFLENRGDEAYDLLSKRCRERTTRQAFVILVQAAQSFGGAQEIKSLTVDQLSGDMARVSYTYDQAQLNQRGEPWTREDGVWRQDDC